MLRTLPFLLLPGALFHGCTHHVVQAPIAFPGELATAVTPPAGTNTSTQDQPGAAPPASTAQRAGERETLSNRAASESAIKDALVQINTLLDAYFDFNAHLLRPDAVEAVTGAASILKSHMAADAAIRLIVEGHCDERGSAEFNLALGDRRAESVRNLLAQLGIPAQRMTTISYGEAKPDCVDSTEACWQKNRRAHIRYER